jgi:hypothetical protein
MKKILVLCLALLPVACGGEGGGNDITGPSTRTPNVAGNYSGTTTVVFPELGRTASCPTTTSVTQSGNTVSIAPLQLGGDCGGVSIPLGQTTIDATGSLGSETGSITDTCGVYNYTASGGFFGREMRLSMIATSNTCWNMNLTINLTH